MEFDYVTLQCPLGYVFENSTNTTHYAICYNWEYTYPFDLFTLCERKSS